MEKNLTFESLPSAIVELAGKVDLILNLLDAKIEKREEIPKYLTTEKALAYLNKIGFPISMSKLYKLTSVRKIPVHKNGNTLLFLSEELDKWCEDKVSSSMSDESKFKLLIKTSRKKDIKTIYYGK